MTTPVKLAGFILALAVVFLGARGVGAVISSLAEPDTPMAHDEMAEEGEHGDHEAEPAADHGPGGLASSEQGYSFRILSQPEPGTDRPLRLVIDGPDGDPVTSYDEVHDQPLHLIKIRRDGADYEHVHPTLGDDGVWTARLTLSPGSSRLFADFTPTAGPALVLGTDVELPGAYEPSPAPAVTSTDLVGGYEITLSGDLVAGESSPLTATVTLRGEPVTDLQPYLGAFGHLVALREGDLAYLHVHPEESDAGPEIPFLAEVPSAGRYRLFLDFRHEDLVRTASFTLATHEGGDHEH